MQICARHRGFTLLEFSIVLLIIGALAGAIVVGNSVVHNSRRQSALADVERFINATQLFRDKYKSLPGDMPNATSFWGAAHVTPAQCYTTPSTGTPTCNGNGDGSLGAPMRSGAGGPAGESLRYWQHLANAELITGKYSGVWTGSVVNIGVNIPASSLPGNGFSIQYEGIGSGGYKFGGNGENYKHVLSLGSDSPSINDTPAWRSGLSGDDALAIDMKMDDGKPGMGKVQTFLPNAIYVPLCAATTLPDSSYYVAGSRRTCALIFKTGF